MCLCVRSRLHACPRSVRSPPTVGPRVSSQVAVVVLVGIILCVSLRRAAYRLPWVERLHGRHCFVAMAAHSGDISVGVYAL